MNTDEVPRLGGWQQTWRLGAAAAAGVPVWLVTGVLLPKGQAAQTGSWFATGDPLVALGCLTLLLWRRRFPLAVAMIVTLASTVSTLATGAALLALASISTRRRPVEIGVVVLAYVVASSLVVGLYPIPGSDGVSWLERVVIPALTAGLAVALGTAVGARRVEVRSLRERAESAEREQAARAAQARALERNRIAREMHDVLAHRISLVAMQAGVLGHRSHLTPEDNRTLVSGIAEGSQQALEELRDVLGVLRADPDRPEPPQPSFSGIPELVENARVSGLEATLSSAVTGTPSDTLGRTCYRVVQEGLTNAAKHAPGAAVRVTLEGAVGGELCVTVRNSRPGARAARSPSSGFGLTGLGERVTLADGTLDHGPASDGGYRLTARLPWPHQPQER